MKLSVGILGEEDSYVIPYQVLPGGSNVVLPVEFFKNKRLSMKAVNQSATVGDLVINFFG